MDLVCPIIKKKFRISKKKWLVKISAYELISFANSFMTQHDRAARGVESWRRAHRYSNCVPGTVQKHKGYPYVFVSRNLVAAKKNIRYSKNLRF